MKAEYIDSLRGFAILAVLSTHCQLYGTNHLSPALKSLLNHGSLGVQLFFIVSALTLCLSFEERSQQEKRPILNFYLRRFFRIAPLFYLAIAFYYFYFNARDRLIFGISSPVNLATILSSLTFTHGLRPDWINVLVPGSWSIAVEMTFYLFFPLLFTRIKNLKTALWSSLFSAIIFQFIYHFLVKQTPLGSSRLWHDYLFYFFPSQLPVFLIGFSLYHLIKIKKICLKPSPVDLVLGQLFILLLIIQLATQTVFPYHFVFSILFAVGAYFLSLSPSRLFVNPFTVFIGKISFSLYIIHFAVLKLMENYHLVDFVAPGLPNFIIRYTLLLFVSTCVSFLTHHLIELPGINFGRRIINRLTPLPVGTPPRSRSRLARP